MYNIEWKELGRDSFIFSFWSQQTSEMSFRANCLNQFCPWLSCGILLFSNDNQFNIFPNQ